MADSHRSGCAGWQLEELHHYQAGPAQFWDIDHHMKANWSGGSIRAILPPLAEKMKVDELCPAISTSSAGGPQSTLVALRPEPRSVPLGIPISIPGIVVWSSQSLLLSLLGEWVPWSYLNEVLGWGQSSACEVALSLVCSWIVWKAESGMRNGPINNDNNGAVPLIGPR